MIIIIKNVKQFNETSIEENKNEHWKTVAIKAHIYELSLLYFVEENVQFIVN